MYRSTVDWLGRMAGTTREGGRVWHPKAVAIPPPLNAVGSIARHGARKVEKGGSSRGAHIPFTRVGFKVFRVAVKFKSLSTRTHNFDIGALDHHSI